MVRAGAEGSMLLGMGSLAGASMGSGCPPSISTVLSVMNWMGRSAAGALA